PGVRDQLRVDETTGPVREVLDEGAHLYLTPALRYWRRLAEDDAGGELSDSERRRARGLLLDWLEGETEVSTGEIERMVHEVAGREGKIYCMMDYRPWARIYGYLVSGLASLARGVGYAGLVVLFDEAEFYSLLSAENKEFARTLFKAYARASVPSNRSDLELPFDPEALDLGGYGVQQDLPARYGESLTLYSVFAMTPHEEGVEAIEEAVPECVVTELDRFGEGEYRELAERTTRAYARATDLDEELCDRLTGPLTKIVDGLLGSGFLENPRAAMKFIVEFLDVARHRPDSVGKVVGELREQFVG
ncbi:MAG: hypothetical protein ABEL76_06080, partial [Bradymonadaceae bacterium]